MIWTVIWGGSHTQIYQMSRDEESTLRGYSSQPYLKHIEDYPTCYMAICMEFMQDNAPTYTTNNIIKNCLMSIVFPLLTGHPTHLI